MDRELIMLSIWASFIASVVFWAIFNFIPGLIRYLKIRPRVKKDIRNILLHTLFYIEIPFLHSLHTGSYYQKEITLGKLSVEDYENALYGKCLSPKQCAGEFEHRLLPVGEDLAKHAADIDKKLDLIQRYADYLSTKETLLLKEIGEKIRVYDYSLKDEIIDGLALAPVDPSISYMKNTFFELYQLYQKLQSICDSYFDISKNDSLHYGIARRSIEMKQCCRYYLHRYLIKGNLKLLLDAIHIYGKNKEKSLSKLRQYLMDEKLRLVYLRGYLAFFIRDDEFLSLCRSLRGEEEYREWLECIYGEEKMKKQSEMRNAENRLIIERKIMQQPKITDLDDDIKLKIQELFDGYL